MLYRPLFWTSYWSEDWLNTSNYRGGVNTILLSSASSKTAFCLAYIIGKRIKKGEVDSKMRIVGLTSKKNVEFTRKLGLYHDVVSYDSFSSSLPFAKTQGQRWMYIDFAGNEELNKKIYDYFASPYSATLVAAIALGVTNLSPGAAKGSNMEWSMEKPAGFASSPASSPKGSSAAPSPSTFPPKVEQFFMPEWLDIRKRQLSVQDIVKRQNQAWKELMQDCRRWVELERVYGAENVLQAYRKLVKDGVGPDKGLIWSLWDGEDGVGEGKEGVRAKL